MPSSTKRLAVARPIPLLPPVTTATFPWNFGIEILLQDGNARGPLDLEQIAPAESRRDKLSPILCCVPSLPLALSLGVPTTLFCSLDIVAFPIAGVRRGAPELPDVHRLLIGYCSMRKACA